MKIRTITTGINLPYPIMESIIEKIARFNLKAKGIFQKSGYHVQETRISTQPWIRYLGRLNNIQIIKEIKNIERICIENGIDFLSIGTTTNLKFCNLIPSIIRATSKICTSITIGDIKGGIDYKVTRKAAQTILRISKETKSGYGNFRFAAIANCPPDIPFFPASYHNGKTCFSLGLECSDLVSQAFKKSKTLIDAKKKFKFIFQKELFKLQKTCKDIEKKEKIAFNGIDISPAPSLEKNESIAFAFEKLGLGKFGASGTIAISGMITEVLKTINIKKSGYSGLMLPILEDFGLAKRCSEGFFDIDNILAYSSICGTGLDCIPLPGSISEDKIYAILLDMATLALKLNKPLSARLFPVSGKREGEMTNFKSPFLVDCRILRVK